MQFPSHCIAKDYAASIPLARLTADNKSMGYARIFTRAVLNPGPPDYSFDVINDMPFTNLLIIDCYMHRVVFNPLNLGSIQLLRRFWHSQWSC